MTPEQRAEIRARWNAIGGQPSGWHSENTARACQDIRALLAALDEAEAENEHLRAASEWLQGRSVPDLVATVTRLTAERDRARDLAVRLEQENAAALAIHRRVDGKWCFHEGFLWPCATARALGVEP